MTDARNVVRNVLIKSACVLTLTACAAVYAADDHRTWQHGIDLVKIDGQHFLVWGSWGNPPTPVLGGNWEHDIYFSAIDPARAAGARGARNLSTPPSVLLRKPEAQEPPSTAVNDRGRALVTWEDGEDGINQYAAFWNPKTKQLGKIFSIRDGGHSGHVAASKDRFLAVYSEEWVDGDDGFLGHGTGKNLFARVVNDNGSLGREIAIARGDDEHREDWPLVAGGDDGWMVVWQRYPARTLHAAFIDREGQVRTQVEIARGLRIGYFYDVEYLPTLRAFAVVATAATGGVALLLNANGDVLARTDRLPPTISESRLLWLDTGAGIVAAYPMAPSGVALLNIAKNTIELRKTVAFDYRWDYIGTTGMFISASKIFFATLSRQGVKIFTIDIGPT